MDESTRFRGVRALAAALGFMAFAGAGFGQILTNGSFETPDVSGAGYAFYHDGDSIPGWDFSGSGEAALVNTSFGWPAQDGNQALFFNTESTTPGLSMSQTFTTVASTQYQVTFYQWAANISGGTPNMGFYVDAFDGATSLTGGTGLTTNSQTTTQTLETFNFTATSSSTTLMFTDISGDTNLADLALDNVAVTAAIPEPSTYAAMLGVAALGLAMVRRRKTA
jgi:hypothetical protein